jgi:hypothetical protein
MNFVGVRGGGESAIGVAVPESGYAGEGEVRASEIEESMPESIAIPNVPMEIIGQVMPCAIANSDTEGRPPGGGTVECYETEREGKREREGEKERKKERV